jgi:hypothetical protein
MELFHKENDIRTDFLDYIKSSKNILDGMEEEYFNHKDLIRINSEKVPEEIKKFGLSF